MTLRGVRSVNHYNPLTIEKGRTELISDVNTKLGDLSKNQTQQVKFYQRIAYEADFRQDNGGLVTTGNRRPLSLDKIITHPNPVLVVLRLEVQRTSTGGGIQVWPYNASRNANRVYVYATTANIPVMNQFTIPINANKEILYEVDAVSFTVCQIIVMGWWGT